MRTLLDILAEILGVGRAQFRAESRQRARRWGLVGIVLFAIAMSGCASLYDAQRRTNNHARQSIIQAVPLQANGIGAGVGLNVLALFDSASAMPQTGGEWTTAIVAFVTDAAAAIGTGYAAYQAAQPSGASTASAPPATVNVSGNQGPTSVTVNYGKKKP